MKEINIYDFFTGKYCSLPNFDNIEQYFFERIVLKNNTHKTTNANRMNDVNQIILELLKKNNVKSPEVLDVAVSSGISTIEMFDVLVQSFPLVKLTGTDAYLKGYVLKISETLNALTDSKGYLLNFNTAKELYGNFHKKRMLTKGLIPYLFLKIYLFFFFKILIKRRKLYPMTAHQILLANPIIQNNQNISLIEDNLLEHNPAMVHKYDLIRAANIINKAYFSNFQIIAIIENLKQRMKQGGLLVILRTGDDKKSNGTVYKYSIADNTFELIHRIGKGSEIEDLIITP